MPEIVALEAPETQIIDVVFVEALAVAFGVGCAEVSAFSPATTSCLHLGSRTETAHGSGFLATGYRDAVRAGQPAVVKDED